MAEKKDFSFTSWFLVGGAVIFVAWFLSAVVIYNIFPNSGDRGAFGDQFGAINALFSGWAFLGVIIAIILQKQELEEQRKELKLSREAHQKSVEALDTQSEFSRKQVELSALSHLLDILNGKISRSPSRNDRGTKALGEQRKRIEGLLRNRVEDFIDTMIDQGEPD